MVYSGLKVHVSCGSVMFGLNLGILIHLMIECEFLEM